VPRRGRRFGVVSVGRTVRRLFARICEMLGLRSRLLDSHQPEARPAACVGVSWAVGTDVTCWSSGSPTWTPRRAALPDGPSLRISRRATRPAGRSEPRSRVGDVEHHPDHHRWMVGARSKLRARSSGNVDRQASARRRRCRTPRGCAGRRNHADRNLMTSQSPSDGHNSRKSNCR
jgi:hypothetical protein